MLLRYRITFTLHPKLAFSTLTLETPQYAIGKAYKLQKNYETLLHKKLETYGPLYTKLSTVQGFAVWKRAKILREEAIFLLTIEINSNKVKSKSNTFKICRMRRKK